MDERTQRLKEIFERGQRDPAFKAKTQARLSSDPAFFAAFKGYLETMQTERQPQPERVKEVPLEPQPELSPRERLSQMRENSPIAKNPIEIGQQLSDFGDKMEQKKGILPAIYSSTFGNQGATGLAKDLTSGFTVGKEAESRANAEIGNSDQQVKLIKAIQESNDPQAIERMGQLLRTLREESNQNIEGLEDLQSGISTNKEALGKLGNTAVTVLGAGTFPGAAKASVATKGFLPAMKESLKFAAPLAAAGGASDAYARGGSNSDAAIGAGIGAVAAPLMSVGSRFLGRAISPVGRKIVGQQRFDKLVDKGITPKVGSGKKDAALRGQLSTEGGSIFTRKDVLADDYGRARAKELLQSTYNKNTSKSLPNLRKATEGKILELQAELGSEIGEVVVPDFQKQRVLNNFNNTVAEVGEQFSSNTKKDTQVRNIISNFSEDINKATTLEDFLSARQKFDREMASRIKGYQVTGEDAGPLVDAIRQVRAEAANSIVDSAPSNMKQAILQNLEDQHILLEAKEQIINNSTAKSELERFFRTGTGRAIQTVGSAGLGLGIGALGTAVGLGGLRLN